MSDKVAEITTMMNADSTAGWVGFMWNNFNNQRAPKIAEWQEMRDFIFATDTSTTSAGEIGRAHV